MRELGVLLSVLLLVVDSLGGDGVDKTTKDKNPVMYGPWSKRDMRVAVVGDLDVERRGANEEKFYEKNWAVKNGHSWSYSDWSSANHEDGFLCRTSSDCTWLDLDLECYSIQPTVKSHLWFGGNAQDVAGSCRCLDNFWWDQDDLVCQRWGEARYEGLLTWHIVLIVLASIAGGCCLCEGCGRFAIRRSRRQKAKNRDRDRETAQEQDVHLDAMEGN